MIGFLETWLYSRLCSEEPKCSEVGVKGGMETGCSVPQQIVSGS